MPRTTRLLNRRQAVQTLAGTVAGLAFPSLLPTSAAAKESKESIRTIPSVPGEMAIELRRRVKDGEGYRSVVETTTWKASETAIIICDMWKEHPCKLAQMRAGRMAPRMNEVVSLARDHGAAVIHAPSGGMKHYEDTSYRQRMKDAVYAKPPVPIQGWCYHNPEREGKWPIVDDVKRGRSDVSGCDDPVPMPQKNHDRHEHPAIQIIGYDGISDNGQEIFNFLEQEGRQNVVLMGVHTNMCVLGRPFGIRQQKYLGKNVVLCRDLTDALYDPRDKPYVSHARGLELVIEHIETYWCPSILAEDLTRVLAGTAGPSST